MKRYLLGFGMVLCGFLCRIALCLRQLTSADPAAFAGGGSCTSTCQDGLELQPEVSEKRGDEILTIQNVWTWMFAKFEYFVFIFSMDRGKDWVPWSEQSGCFLLRGPMKGICRAFQEYYHPRSSAWFLTSAEGCWVPHWHMQSSKSMQHIPEYSNIFQWIFQAIPHKLFQSCWMSVFGFTGLLLPSQWGEGVLLKASLRMPWRRSCNVALECSTKRPHDLHWRDAMFATPWLWLSHSKGLQWSA